MNNVIFKQVMIEYASKMHIMSGRYNGIFLNNQQLSEFSSSTMLETFVVPFL